MVLQNVSRGWSRSCSRTLGLMTENSWNHVCEPGQSKAISITLHMARGRQTSCYGKMKAERSEGSIWTTHVPWRHKRREMMAIAGIQMACKKQTAIRCKLQIMQKGTRTTRCKHWKFARRDIWAHQQCFLRWNGDNRHGCPPLHLETSVCQHATCTNTSEYAQVCHTWWR